jgi:hypothetical protein
MPATFNLTEMSDETLATYGHDMPALVQSEFMRRQTIIARQTGEDQKRAADAMVATAKATKDNAKYMLLSVIVLTVASILNLLVSFVHYS